MQMPWKSATPVVPLLREKKVLYSKGNSTAPESAYQVKEKPMLLFGHPWINNVTEALFANALQSQYLLCQPEDAAKIQPIAQEYLFDTKVLTLISSEKEIQKIAELSIDGVIFPEAITLG